MILIPLTDASRRPTRMPAVTAILIALNALMFVLELAGGEPFVKRGCLCAEALSRSWNGPDSPRSLDYGDSSVHAFIAPASLH